MRVTLLILCPMPVGPGNLALLQEALMAARRGIRVLMLAPALAGPSNEAKEQFTTNTGNVLLEKTGMIQRDYTNGEGLKVIQDLLQAGATVVGSVAEAVEAAKF